MTGRRGGGGGEGRGGREGGGGHVAVALSIQACMNYDEIPVARTNNGFLKGICTP